MNLETIITEKVRALPAEKQQRVLNSIEEIEREAFTNVVEQNDIDDKKLAIKDESKRNKLIGMFRSGKSDISERAEEILMAEIDKRSGWTVKK